MVEKVRVQKVLKFKKLKTIDMKHSGIFSKGKNKQTNTNSSVGENSFIYYNIIIMAYVSNDNPWDQSKE